MSNDATMPCAWAFSPDNCTCRTDDDSSYPKKSCEMVFAEMNYFVVTWWGVAGVSGEEGWCGWQLLLLLLYEYCDASEDKPFPSPDHRLQLVYFFNFVAYAGACRHMDGIPFHKDESVTDLGGRRALSSIINTPRDNTDPSRS